MIVTIATTSMKKNGKDAQATNQESRPLIDCSTNSTKPTGGVTSAISTSSTMKMPNQTGSIPTFWIIGSTMVVVSTIIETPSSAVPRITYMTVSTAMSWYFDRVEPGDEFGERPRDAGEAHRDRSGRRRRPG